MEMDVAEFVNQCLRCMNGKTEMLKLRLLGEIVHGTKVAEVIYFYFSHLGMGKAFGDNGISNEAIKNLLVLVNNMSSYA